jgi:hypothetical protein
MKLNVSTPIATPELTAMLESVGAGAMLQGTVYGPLMQLLLAPAQQGEDSLMIWELSQKLYANKEGTVNLSGAELAILKTKCEQIAFPWLKARVLDILSPKLEAVAG